MSSRADRRRQQRQSLKSGPKLPASGNDPVLDIFVHYAAPMQPDDLWACIASLPVDHQRAPYLLFVNADCRLRDPFAVDLALGHLSQGRAVVGALLAYGDQVAAAGYAFGTRGPYPRYAG